ncbi:MAG TPA: cytochrome c biogenesis protein CcdA [Hungateiclostridium thermocellum]|uniref:Cytochrome c biogenesis protein transmembrane region n=2 Tax=Acetivibrio thermocellus TaxID=1515 RepID=A3DGT7_ACET2|nr:cytochrome c biogenesis CcdA family protein [Acetivibrio thermocellus]CDG36466.1 cytochrome c biogenesis protein, transmembrane region [Acetivibrio thermocellus BC1]ABN53166.1 cytochrome c biogenesis protein transmembrane region [Acetivibrio thermocellus ATCC 27405]ADU75620.1 cytochrome c biogenesis protein transmembrane region [Acetivibrio thermocellus DSM 1313]ALX09613.1 cytochrome c biogenesis protein transmembrane region [Acetivibrio thermocellus AD2]ANV77387.1 cytochrome c biogenesis p
MDSSVYVTAFAEGILTFVSPCIFPMLPAYFSYLAGFSDKEDKDGKNKRRLLINSLGFVLGFTIVFTLLGAAATSLGAFLKEHRDVLKIISGIVIIIFGLNFIGILNIGFLNREKRFEYKADSLKFVGSVIFGFCFAFGWTPCISYFLASILALAANSSTMPEGLMLLVVYSLGLGIPFIVSAMIFESIREAFNFIKSNMRIINIISGILLILLGAAMLFNII